MRLAVLVFSGREPTLKLVPLKMISRMVLSERLMPVGASLTSLTARAKALAPSLTWHAVAARYRDVFDELVPTGAGAHRS
jgi:hypothetical protein